MALTTRPCAYLTGVTDWLVTEKGTETDSLIEHSPKSKEEGSTVRMGFVTRAFSRNQTGLLWDATSTVTAIEIVQLGDNLELGVKVVSNSVPTT